MGLHGRAAKKPAARLGRTRKVKKTVGNSVNLDTTLEVDTTRVFCKKTGYRKRLSEAPALFGLIRRKQLARLAEALLNYTVRTGFVLASIQFGPETNRSSGKKVFVRGSFTQRMCHYFVILLFSANVFHKFAMTVTKFHEDKDLSVEVIMCIIVLVHQLVGWAMSLSLTFRWRESVQMLNTWDSLVQAMDEAADLSPAALRLVEFGSAGVHNLRLRRLRPGIVHWLQAHGTSLVPQLDIPG